MYVDAARNGTTQAVTYTGTAGVSSTAFDVQTRQVRIVANSACHYVITKAGTAATTSDPFLPPNWVYHANCLPGEKISAVQAATNGLTTATAGTLWVTELTS